MEYFWFFCITVIFCESVICFPEDFIFSAASSAYQIEGGWNADGKGENIWDHFVHKQPNSIEGGADGDIACDSYHRYKEDVALLTYMGFQMYRFSISWTRILPTGTLSKINKAGVDYYHNLIDELLQQNIQPMVTIYHWDLPQQLQDIGGWTNPMIAKFAEEYADFLFREYGDKVKWWITINEPNLITWGYTDGWLAPGTNLSWSYYIIGHNLLRAHGKIYKLYDSKYRAAQNGKLSLSLHVTYFEAMSNKTEDMDAAERAMIFSLDMYAHPIYSTEGDYPPLMKQRIEEDSKTEENKESILPVFTKDEIDSLRGSYDFLGINYYCSSLCVPKLNNFTSFNDKNMAADCQVNSSLPKSDNPRQVFDPSAFRRLLLWIRNRYNASIFITEHGWFGKEEFHDINKTKYHQAYLKEILALVNDNYPLIGYTVWSLMDNFEWNSGYEYRFGLAHVDFEDPQRKRTPKLSAEFFKELNRLREIPDITKFEGKSNSARPQISFLNALVYLVIYLYILLS